MAAHVAYIIADRYKNNIRISSSLSRLISPAERVKVKLHDGSTCGNAAGEEEEEDDDDDSLFISQALILCSLPGRPTLGELK